MKLAQPKSILAVLFITVCSVTASAQDYEKHGKLTGVSMENGEITILMNDLYFVDPGSTGRVVGPYKGQTGIWATIKVSSVDGKTVVCEIVEPGVTLTTDMFASFNDVQTVSALATLEITATPPGARISLNGVDKGPTPQALELESGSYQVEVSASGYVPQSETYILSAPEKRPVHFTLNPVARFGSLSIDSEPSNAKLYIDKEPAENTPYNREKFQAGSHSVRLELEGYDPLITDISVLVNKQFENTFALIPTAKDTMFLDVSYNVDDQLQFLIDFKRRTPKQTGTSNTSNGSTSEEMVLIVTVPLDDSRQTKAPVLLKPGISEPLVYDLKVPIQDGQLSIRTSPKIVRYTIKGPGNYSLEDSTSRDIPVPPGSYELSFSKDGYNSEVKNVVVTPRYKVPVNVTLVKDNYVTSSASIEFVRVWAGSFTMGSSTGPENERPVTQVTLTNDFFMSKTEITQAQYEKIIGENPSVHSGAGLPVGMVTWEDAAFFANRLSVAEGLQPCYDDQYGIVGTLYLCQGYRLPTEAEWEFATRQAYDLDGESPITNRELLTYGWFETNSESRPRGVGLRDPTKNGIAGLLGNVWEWTNDWYSSDYKNVKSINPEGGDTGQSRVIRGGYYMSPASTQYITRRQNHSGSLKELGIRLVRSAL